ncbi:PepSY domain-containing protein [Aerococcaceae bacterium WGS1372]
MKKSLKKLVLLGVSGMMLTAVMPQVMAQESSEESTTEESVAGSTESTETTDEEATEESELQTALNEAIELFKAEYPETELKEIDVELRKEEYKITIHGFSGTNEYEVDFSVDPVEITNKEEDNDDDDNDDDALVLEDLITIDEASDIALEEAGGGMITDWNLDTDDGKAIWELEIEDPALENTDNNDDDDDNKLHVEIDATTGEVLKVEFDD